VKPSILKRRRLQEQAADLHGAGVSIADIAARIGRDTDWTARAVMFISRVRAAERDEGVSRETRADWSAPAPGGAPAPRVQQWAPEDAAQIKVPDANLDEPDDMAALVLRWGGPIGRLIGSESDPIAACAASSS
jgi:hypothetical protein